MIKMVDLKKHKGKIRNKKKKIKKLRPPPMRISQWKHDGMSYHKKVYLQRYYAYVSLWTRRAFS